MFVLLPWEFHLIFGGPWFFDRVVVVMARKIYSSSRQLLRWTKSDAKRSAIVNKF